MQSIVQVIAVTSKIASLGFVTGIYLYKTDDGDGYIGICFAADGQHRRYFRVGYADTKQPVIYLISRTESGKPIEKVNFGLVDRQITLGKLILGGHDSVLRCLELYKALYERKKLKLADFFIPNMEMGALSSRSGNGFIAHVCDLESLKPDKNLSYGGDFTEEGAHIVAKSWTDKNSFAVVTNQYGFTVAAYHQGERIV